MGGVIGCGRVRRVGSDVLDGDDAREGSDSFGVAAVGAGDS